MKYLSAALVALSASTAQARLPPGFTPVSLPTPPTAPAPVAAPVPVAPTDAPTKGAVCDPVLDPDYESDSYVVVQYDPSKGDCYNLSSNATLTAIGDAYYRAYAQVDGACTQNGAFCELYGAEVKATQPSSNTILLRVGTYCNAGTYLNGDKTSCGVGMYTGSDATPLVDFARKMQSAISTGEACSCPRPDAATVVATMNEAIRQSIPCPALPAVAGVPTPAPTALEFITATEQLCVTECHNTTKGEFTYSSAGVSEPCDRPKLTRKPSKRPTKYPTRRPTKRPTKYPTKRPTKRPTKFPTKSPTAEPTAENDPTAAPSEEPAPTDEPVEPTAEPVDPTAAPVEPTAAPVAPTPEPTPESTNSTGRFLASAGDENFVEVTSQVVKIDTFAFAYEKAEDHNVCSGVDAKLVNNAANRAMCENYLNLPLVRQDESECSSENAIPKIWYSVSAHNEATLSQVGVAASNPDFEHRHFGDEEALAFVKENCGEHVASAYECLAPPAFRGDLFRFCALHTTGGVYMDADMLPLVPIDDLYDPCAVATVGHDWPQGRPQKQMKILAGRAGAPIFKCMLDKIVGNVKSRYYPTNPLALTGPMLLHECYEDHSEGVSVTYRDTRNAAYPYSGMRAGDDLLAFEIPAHNKNYKIDFDDHEVYRDTCSFADDAAVGATAGSM